DAVGNQLLRDVALHREVGAGVAEDDAVGRASSHLLACPYDQREERVCYVGHDHGQRPGLARAQPAGESTWDVAEVGDRLLHTTLRVRTDSNAAVDHARHGHRRDACQLGDFPDGHVGGFRGHCDSLVAITHISVGLLTELPPKGLTLEWETCYRYHEHRA